MNSVRIQRGNGSFTFHLSIVVNLVLHTYNLYDLLGEHGKTYPLRTDRDALQFVDKEIHRKVSGQDCYFGSGSLDLFRSTMIRLMEDESRMETPEGQLDELSPDPMNRALNLMWEGFYRSYWQNREPQLSDDFATMCAGTHWSDLMDQMEQLTGETWSKDMLILPVEATAESALTWDRVCIGTLDPAGDAGFVHEGLHLLLGGSWRQSPKIRALWQGRSFEDAYWLSWESMYEQAIVTAFSSILRGESDDRARLAFQGCRVEVLFDVAWPLSQAHAREGSHSLEDLMLELIVSGEQRRRSK